MIDLGDSKTAGPYRRALLHRVARIIETSRPHGQHRVQPASSPLAQHLTGTLDLFVMRVYGKAASETFTRTASVGLALAKLRKEGINELMYRTCSFSPLNLETT